MQTFSPDKLYLNSTQNQIYTASKLLRLFGKWSELFTNGVMNTETFVKLYNSHFENLIELPKYHTINNKNHSIQCSYATVHDCTCWCNGEFHGKLSVGIAA